MYLISNVLKKDCPASPIYGMANGLLGCQCGAFTESSLVRAMRLHRSVERAFRGVASLFWQAARERSRVFGLRLALVGALAASSCASLSWAQTPGFYRIDLPASRIEIRVFRTGFLSGLGDNHQIALQQFGGTAEGDPATGWKAHVVGEAASLKVVDPGSAPSTREEIQRTMLGPEQMEVQRFPKIEMETVASKPGPEKQTWNLEVQLTLHGVSRRVEFPVTWSEKAETLRVRGKKSLRLRDFNIQPISRGWGAVKVRNEFEVVYDIALRRVSGAAH